MADHSCHTHLSSSYVTIPSENFLYLPTTKERSHVKQYPSLLLLKVVTKLLGILVNEDSDSLVLNWDVRPYISKKLNFTEEEYQMVCPRSPRGEWQS